MTQPTGPALRYPTGSARRYPMAHRPISLPPRLDEKPENYRLHRGTGPQDTSSPRLSERNMNDNHRPREKRSLYTMNSMMMSYPAVANEERISPLKLRVNELAGVLDMHGVQNLQKTMSVFRRIIWAVFLLALICVLAWQLEGVISYFIERPTSTSFEYVYARKQDFPAVTICNNNPFRKSHFQYLQEGKTKEFMKKMLNDDEKKIGVRMKNKKDTFNWDEVDYRTNRDDYVMNHEFYSLFMSLPRRQQMAVGYKMNDMLLDCTFAGKSCSPRNFTQTSHAQFGNCYTFNTASENESVVVSRGPGPLQGLSLIMYINQDDYYYQVAESSGMKVLVHHQDTMPFPEDEGILVAPGFDTQIGLRKVSIHRLGDPHGNCQTFSYEEGKLRDAYVEQLTGVNYTAVGCEKTCLQKGIVRKCGCKYAVYAFTGTAFSGDPAVTQATFCNMTNEGTRECIEHLEDKLHSRESNCSTVCPNKCNDTLYQTTVASSSWPAIAKERQVIYMASKISENINNQIGKLSPKEQRQFISQNLLKISVFYQDMRFERIVTSEAYSWTEMVADIGGTVELYMGLSIVTFFQLLEFVVDLGLLGCGLKK